MMSVDGEADDSIKILMYNLWLMFFRLVFSAYSYIACRYAGTCIYSFSFDARHDKYIHVHVPLIYMYMYYRMHIQFSYIRVPSHFYHFN